MRVIAGSCRSMPLKTVRGNATRPTTDRIKETLFNILAPEIADCRFLDLFAGSGGIGIEALSRGASFACFCDAARAAISVIRENLRFTGLEEKAEVLHMDAISALANLSGRGEAAFDLIFIDPPYQSTLVQEAVAAIAGNKLLADTGCIIAEMPTDVDTGWVAETGFSIWKQKIYKTNQHLFLIWGE